MKILAFVLLLPLVASVPQDPAPAQPTEHHKWLHDLVGQWTAKSEMSMGPGTEPMRMESSETVRSIGGLWIQAEGTATMNGQPFTTVMTLGYDANKGAFVGTWIDTMQTHMWVYRGTLDDAKKVLTLEAEGPSFTDPKKLAKYRDTIEMKSKDHRTLTSSLLGDDGKWTSFMTAHYHRKK
jgi:hypothetical protein